jgi:hypothetical protein
VQVFLLQWIDGGGVVEDKENEVRKMTWCDRCMINLVELKNLTNNLK